MKSSKTKKIYRSGTAEGNFGKDKSFRPTWVEISSSAFKKNLNQIFRAVKKPVKVMAVVKANAYGHGAVALSKIAIASGVSMLGVSSIEEGAALRRAGIKKAILILGSIYPHENFSHVLEHDLIPTISSPESLLAFERAAIKMKNVSAGFHLKVDTGMRRVGASPQKARQIIDRAQMLKGVKMEGLYTHFASAGEDDTFTEEQFDKFKGVVNYARQKGLRFIAHAANSDALFLFPEMHLDMVRPGISIYGLWPHKLNGTEQFLQPVLSWKTKIVFLKKVQSGVSISYSRTYYSKKPITVATLPVGYADGYDRQLSNKGEVLVGGVRCPVIGRVTMDMIMADVSAVSNVDVGDEVVLIGRQGAEEITVREIAQQTGTISYDVVCSIGSRVPRFIV